MNMELLLSEQIVDSSIFVVRSKWAQKPLKASRIHLNMLMVYFTIGTRKANRSENMMPERVYLIVPANER